MSVVYVDVSAKLENWSADSVIAMTNGSARVLVVTAPVKQAVRQWLRRRYPHRKGTYHALVLMAAPIRVIVADDLAQIEYIVIDRDYPGDGIQAKLKKRISSVA
ncbi:MAG: hypothetical protein IPK16_00285 [Anaerolineales bacterium]|nr:hypothetical protein [Anaerolineales bacterium]